MPEWEGGKEREGQGGEEEAGQQLEKEVIWSEGQKLDFYSSCFFLSAPLLYSYFRSKRKTNSHPPRHSPTPSLKPPGCTI